MCQVPNLQGGGREERVSYSFEGGSGGKGVLKVGWGGGGRKYKVRISKGEEVINNQ